MLLCQFIQNIFEKKKNEGEISLAEKAGDRGAFSRNVLLLCLQGISYYNALAFFCCCRFGEGYIITVRVQGDIPDLDPLFLFFSEKFPRATLKVGARLKSVLAFV